MNNDLFNEKGERLGLLEVAKWWCETYPASVFPIREDGSGHLAARVRVLMEEIISIIEKKSVK